MPDYKQLRIICEKNQEVSAEVIDDYLIYYAARQNKLDQEMERLAKPFKPILRKLPAGMKGYLKSQYITHRIFKNDGLIHKYLKHNEIQHLKTSEKQYLHYLTTPSLHHSITPSPHH